MTARAIILARGLGTRMRRADPGAALTAAQQQAADAGAKPLMPIGGRPFLDYVVSALADAGLREIGLIVAPDHRALQSHYAAHPPTRAAVAFLVQAEARGTADALLAAEAWLDARPFLVLNADNLYPVEALRALAALAEPAVAAFEPDDLVRTGNIPAERLRSFALIETDAGGYVTGILEKPSDVDVPASGAGRRISMNLWRFDAGIFGPCRDVPASPRGEYELPQAVGLAVSRGMRIRAAPARGPVLDLSSRGDAADVERRLRGVAAAP